MQRPKKWRVKSPNPALQHIISTELGVSHILAQLLINRGIYTVDQARAFLGSELNRLFSPWLMKDMEKAVERILLAREKGEYILVYGDYDVDGITGTTILVLALRKLGCQVDYFIPHRLEEGYGLNKEALERAVEQGVTLVVTVDCGISGAAEVAAARELSLDIVITDHHEPPDILPPAVAVVNPKRNDCHYPFKELAGVGVALKLIQGLFQRAGLGQREWEEYLDLVCLGTVADIVPLQGENRIIVKHGLDKISNTCRPGLQALIKISGIRSESLGTRELGFGLAPRLNAAGRMGDATLGVELLLASDPTCAEELATALNKGNQERQQVEAKVLSEAMALLEAHPTMAEDKVLVLSSANWHPGVIGIVASRLVDRFYRPVLMISLEDGKGKGSARSIPGFNLYQAMVNCQDYLQQFGGHAMAAGFSIDADKIDDFRLAINKYADEVLTEELLTPNLDLDAMVQLTDLSLDTVQELDQLSPFGHCNPGPILGCCEATVINCREVGKNGGHLKLRVRGDHVILDGIGFNMASYSEMLATNDTIDMAFVPSINVWHGRASVQLEVKEFKQVGSATSELGDNLDAADPEIQDLLKKSLFLPKEKLRDCSIPTAIGELYRQPERNGSSSFGRPVWAGVIEDYRDYPDRIARLMQILSRGATSLILVESTSQVLQVASLLNYGEHSWRANLAVYHPLLEAKELQQLAAYLQAGKIKMLVSTSLPPTMVSEHPFEQVIFFHLPYQAKELALVPGTGSRLILLGGKAQAPDAQEHIKAMAPDREVLGELFKLLRYKFDKLGQQQVVWEELYQCLREICPRVGSHTVEIGLQIFQELNLIKYEKQGYNYTFKINLDVRSDLQHSSTYKWAQQNRQALIKFQSDYLSATALQLRQLLQG